MSESLQIAVALGKLCGMLVLLSQAAMLAMQGAMFRRHGHSAFLWLSLSSLLGLAYTIISISPYFIDMSESVLLALQMVDTGLLVVCAAMGLYGTRGLFRAYDRLAEHSDGHRSG